MYPVELFAEDLRKEAKRILKDDVDDEINSSDIKKSMHNLVAHYFTEIESIIWRVWRSKTDPLVFMEKDALRILREIIDADIEAFEMRNAVIQIMTHYFNELLESMKVRAKDYEEI